MIAAMAKHGLLLLGLCAFVRAQTQPAAEVTRDVKSSVQAVDPSVHPEVDGQPIAPTDADTRQPGRRRQNGSRRLRSGRLAFWPSRLPEIRIGRTPTRYPVLRFVPEPRRRPLRQARAAFQAANRNRTSRIRLRPGFLVQQRAPVSLRITAGCFPRAKRNVPSIRAD